MGNQDLLSRILSLQYGKLAPNQLLKLRERLEAIHDAHPMGLTVGTGCSGSEVIMLVLSKLADVWRSTFGISITFRHLFSIESVHWKRQWIMKHFRPELLFTDITCVHGSDSLHDAISGELKPLPACHFFFCGIECDSISGLNGQADPGYIQAGHGKSGETASGCFEYIRKRRPLLWMVENVRALSNMPGAKHGGAWPGVPIRVLPGARPGAPAMRRSRTCSAFWTWETTWATWCRRQPGFCPGHGGQQRVSGHSEQRTSAIGQQGGVHIGRVCLWSTFTHATCQTTHGTHHKAQVSEMTAHVAHVRLHTWGTCRLQMWHMLFPSRSALPADAI